jgi:3-deoxy-alpha-D-manno-octulosonate 8-oxidase
MVSFKTFTPVPKVIFSRGAISFLAALLDEKRSEKGYVVFVIDHFFKANPLNDKVSICNTDLCLFLDTTDEPKTATIDLYADFIKKAYKKLPSAVVGIGGGSTLDTAKALAIMLTNPGQTHEYQGWDLVKIKPVYKIGVPTLSGTGSEVSRTTVLTGPEKKQGINSEYSLFDHVVLDPDLLATVPTQQRFYTGMDCYIHCVESLAGTFLNEFSGAFASKALELCEGIFLHKCDDADLMVASYMGGSAIVYSEVGVCHALSYGISYAFGVHHGLANCVVFNHLEEYYPQYLPYFKEMLIKNQVTLPERPVGIVNDTTLNKMIDITLLMEKPLHNALGPQWKSIFTRDIIGNLYKRILGL